MTTLKKLESLSDNVWWSWNPEAQEIFRMLNPDAFTASHQTPKVALTYAKDEVLSDPAFVEKVDAVYAAFSDYMSSKGKLDGPLKVAYFCMEYGLHESLPLYSGGLGVLAGDHCKAASDLGVDFSAVGLFLRDGYFKQFFDKSGWQQAEFPSLDATQHPFHLVTDENGEQVVVTVHLGFKALHLRAWRLDVGRIPLYLLDSDFEANPFELRFLTRRLYQGNRTTRIQQEIILGIGGARLMRAIGREADVYHMNEGHCAFVTFELMRERLEKGDPLPDAEQWVRDHCLFTTHTPVHAGHDRFDPQLFVIEMERLRQQLGMSEDEMMAYGRVHPNDLTEAFTMTILGLKMARDANGVSKLNGEVVRNQWHHLYEDLSVETVPVGHVTNGIHLPTWTAPHARPFLHEHLADWSEHRSDPSFWEKVEDIPDVALWNYRNMLRSRLISFVNWHLKTRQHLPQQASLDPDVLTICFARRFATYKRAPLLFSDLKRATRIFKNADQPIQVIYAGKAHPQDEGGKRFIQEIFEITSQSAFKGRVILLEGYDMQIGRMLTSGADVWLNNPRRPYEASGTSGQKVAMHGGLNLSVLDGWWPEGFNGNNGWSIGSDHSANYREPEIQDREDALFLYEALENDVIPRFYNRDANNLPQGWISFMREALRTLPHAFSAERMVIDYVEQYYNTLETAVL